MMDLYLQMGIALILVSGLILLVGLLTKKRQDRVSLMKVLGYQSLGPKKGLAMVRVGQEVILVGVTATDVKLLKSMEQFAEDTAGARPKQQALQVQAAPAPAPFNVSETGQRAGFQPPVSAGKVIMADMANTADNLGKLKALKDHILCS